MIPANESVFDRVAIQITAPADASLHDILGPLRAAGWTIHATGSSLHLDKRKGGTAQGITRIKPNNEPPCAA